MLKQLSLGQHYFLWTLQSCRRNILKVENEFFISRNFWGTQIGLKSVGQWNKEVLGAGRMDFVWGVSQWGWNFNLRASACFNGLAQESKEPLQDLGINPPLTNQRSYSYRSTTMASQGVESLLALRRQLQERKALLQRQVEEERRRAARLTSNSLYLLSFM